MAPAGAATFIVAIMELRDGSEGWNPMAGSSGSSGNDAVANAAFTSLADVRWLAAGADRAESDSLSRLQLVMQTTTTTMNSVDRIRTVMGALGAAGALSAARARGCKQCLGCQTCGHLPADRERRTAGR